MNKAPMRAPAHFSAFANATRASGAPILNLIEIAAEFMLPGGRYLPVRKSIPHESDDAARKILRELADLSLVDSSVLGMLYESLLERDDPASPKQTRRRKSGIFYTPERITKFLVRAAIDACEISNDLSALDPACGCGAFLIAAYRELRGKFPKVDPRIIASEWLYGIDTDPVAVHVARLSLYIEAGLDERHWPWLESRIMTGDALCECPGQEVKFSVVVGNPPYRSVKRGIPDEFQKFLMAEYKTARGQWDIAAPFVELILNDLLDPGGACGLILPNPIFLAENYRPVRDLILENDLVAFGPAGRAFHDPGVEASLLVARKGKPGRNASVIEARVEGEIKSERTIPIPLIKRLPGEILSHLAEEDFLEPVLDARDSGKLIRLGESVEFTRGLELGKRDSRIVDFNLSTSEPTCPLLTGDSVEPYSAKIRRKFILNPDPLPSRLLKNSALWEGDSQLLVRRVADRPIAAVCSPPSLALNTLYILRGEFDPHAVCALINSRLFRNLFAQLFGFDDSLFPYLRVSQLSQMPIPREALFDKTLSRFSTEMYKLVGENADEKDIHKMENEIERRVDGLYRSSGVTWRKPTPPPRQSRIS